MPDLRPNEISSRLPGLREDIYDILGHKNTKLTYTRFPKDWTAEQIYEYLIARAEEDEKARGHESGRRESPSRGPQSCR